MNDKGFIRIFLVRVRIWLYWRIQSLCKILAPPQGEKIVYIQAENVFYDIALYANKAITSELNVTTIAEAKRCLIDGIACICAGASTSEGISLMKQFGTTFKTLFSSDSHLAIHQKAFLLASLAQIHDANDGNSVAGKAGASYHPGRVLVPVSIATALHSRVSGKTMLKQLAIGYDVSLSVFGAPLDAPADAYGAASAASVALGLDVASTCFAIRVAGFMAPKSGAEDFETNNLTIAQQAAMGVLAAELVIGGYPPSKTQFETSNNFRFTPPIYVGQTLHTLYFKPYPACRYTHGYIEAILRTRPKIQTELNYIQSIEIDIPTRLYGPHRKVGPGEYYKSYQFSTPYVVCAALVDGMLDLSSFNEGRTM